MAATASRRLFQAMAASAQELREWLCVELASGKDSKLLDARDSLGDSLGGNVGVDESADVLAQAAVCAAPIIAELLEPAALAPPRLPVNFAAWERWALDQAKVLSTEYPVPSAARGCVQSKIQNRGTRESGSSKIYAAAHLYGEFLQHYDKSSRKRHGVFFTPQPIADYIVAQVDQILREECGLDHGLASSDAWILDPAVGSGVFLLSVIERLHDAMAQQGSDEGRSEDEIADRWNDFVPTLLPRLVGIEILPVPALLAKLNIAVKLAQTGYRFDEPSKINIVLGDALSPAVQSKIQNRGTHDSGSSKIPLLLGNPPFSSLSTTTNDWIARLVRGDEDIRGYVRANGQRLNERKTWLHDDYVKFIRLAQWHVEEAGCGLVGFVTNHGYLDNATFRLMRQELLRVFPRVRIVDLHGNRKKHEISPDSSQDENVFGLDQGVAVSLFCRPPTLTRRASDGPALTRCASG